MLHIEARQISKSYGEVAAVQAISFTIEPGQIFALLGPNGAGKSSLIRMLVGLTRPDDGEILLRQQDQPLSQLPQRSYGYLPEDRGLYPDRTVRQNLSYIGQLRGIDKTALVGQIEQWCRRLDLLDKLDDNLSKLSKGNQQKVQLISCVLHKPALLILDEPFSGLDPVNQEKVLVILNELRTEGTTVLLSAHQMALVERLADKMLLLNKGQQVAQGSLAEIRQQLAPEKWFAVGLAQQLHCSELQALGSVSEVEQMTATEFKICLAPDASVSQLLQQLTAVAELSDFSRIEPGLHQLYLAAVGQHDVLLQSSAQGNSKGAAA
ncbi:MULTISPECIES: ABC transporter ATP-binding protein [Rheinheimera]|uniref:ABC transporter ATP-binding protein n=1 Tax=Rheinheimera marina TaxID=1774958 RepID=A0ABV9JJP9_9GAMM